METTNKTKFQSTILFVLLLCTVAHIHAAEDHILPLATGEYPPYSSSDVAGYGVMTEIVSAAVKEMGMEPKYGFYPWKRCEFVVKKGEVWAAFPYGYTKERKENFLFSDVLLVTSTQFFYSKRHYKGLMDWKVIEDLKPLSIEGTNGYYYENEFKRAGLNLTYSNKEEVGIRKLRHGRVDLFITDELVGWHLIRKQFPREVGDFDVLPKAHETSGNYLMISRDYPNSKELLSKFNFALRSIKKRGVVDQILEGN